MGRLRIGELVAVLGCGCVIVAMVLPWYESPAGNLDLWDTFGVGGALLLAELAAGLAMVAAALGERRGPALPVATANWCVLLGAIGTVAAITRVLERPDHATGLCAGAWFGLAGAVTILVGAWLVLRDEHQPRYPPVHPPVRPRP